MIRSAARAARRSCISYLLAGAAILGSGHPTGAAWALSDKKAAEIGKEMYEKIIAEIPIYTDPKVAGYVSQIGQRLLKQAGQPIESFTFTVLDKPDINAFATPGGYIYINRGLLAYMNSEAQLAAVLAHEIAHVTEKHASRQQRAQFGSNVVAGLLTILTGSLDVGEASAMWGAASVRGYGRDMELEADAVGARLIAQAGYPTQAVIDMISQLKDHERFTKQRMADSGKKVQTYHGLFATHPRNDKRLLESVKQSNAGGSQGDPGVAAFRIATEALPWGRSQQTHTAKQNRHYDYQRGFTFDHPEGWKFSATGGMLKGQSEDGTAELTLRIKQRTLDAPDAFIKKVLGIGFIRKSEPLIIARLKAHTGIVPGHGGTAAGSDARLTVIYYGKGAYVFSGTVAGGRGSIDDTYLTSTYDAVFKDIAASFRPLARTRQADDPAKLHYVKARAGVTYEKLARQLNLGKYGAAELRLINAHYPSANPQAGEWIKIIR